MPRAWATALERLLCRLRRLDTAEARPALAPASAGRRSRRPAPGQRRWRAAAEATTDSWRQVGGWQQRRRGWRRQRPRGLAGVRGSPKRRQQPALPGCFRRPPYAAAASWGRRRWLSLCWLPASAWPRQASAWPARRPGRRSRRPAREFCPWGRRAWGSSSGACGPRAPWGPRRCAARPWGTRGAGGPAHALSLRP